MPVSLLLAMEQVGYHKRDIMVDEIRRREESQQDAQEEFTACTWSG